MGNVNVTFCKGSPRNIRGLDMIKLDNNNKGENVTSSATAAKTTKQADGAGCWRVATDTNVMITSSSTDGDNPTTSSGTLLMAGQTDYFEAEKDDYLRVINA